MSDDNRQDDARVEIDYKTERFLFNSHPARQPAPRSVAMFTDLFNCAMR